MALPRSTSDVGELHKLISAQCSNPLCDEELLMRFSANQDQQAFAMLVKRHGAMVFDVCQSVLRHTQDAEDACQATFIVLARKASAINKPASVASWLHGVAYRLARKSEAAKRRRHQWPAADRRPPRGRTLNAPFSPSAVAFALLWSSPPLPATLAQE
jgi:DNA-directed RNA polymerase specialized sigma24 family protein